MQMLLFWNLCIITGIIQVWVFPDLNPEVSLPKAINQDNRQHACRSLHDIYKV